MASDADIVAAKAAALLGQRLAAMRSPGWQPLPHQIPPTGDWTGWLLLAGRGAGKSDACAHYIAEHVKGPACLPGPVPHWIGIIAPTLGDASTSCYGGPSGLRVHSPDARLVNRPGGLTVLWPNGSEAKLFGAHTPEDVERLRSGGNRCIREGSLVRTEFGPVSIEEVQVGDRVWTRNGLRRVLAVWDNGIRDVRPYEHAAGVTWMTPDHEVWTGEGWKQAQSVRTDDTVFTWLSSSNTTASAGTPASAIRTTATAIAGCCTAGCGPRKSGPYQPGCRCTTRTTTSGTTASPTSPCSELVSTGPSTATNAASTGTARAATPLGRRSSPATSPASAALRSSAADPLHALCATAPTPAGTLRHGHGRSGCAACAATGSPPESGAQPAPVRVSALRITSHGSSAARVFDLTVEHDHEFFADDLLVSNCVNWYEELAAWRYLDEAWAHARFGLRTGPNPRWVASTTPKPRPLIKRLNQGTFEGAVLTRASFRDNPHLPQHIKDALEQEYGGTQLGRQELYGEVIDQDENALWTHELIEAARVRPDVAKAHMDRITVGVDPSGGAGEQGIVVAGKALLPGPDGRSKLVHGYVLADRTVRMSPGGWGRRAVQAAIDFEADDIVVERNYGGQLAVTTIRAAADAMGVPIPIREVWATNGKRVRAAPVAALTEQVRWHHAGVFPELEDQLCTWHEELDWSPDRLDAMVWTAWHNKVVHRHPAVGSRGMSMAATRTIG